MATVHVVVKGHYGGFIAQAPARCGQVPPALMADIEAAINNVIALFPETGPERITINVQHRAVNT